VGSHSPAAHRDTRRELTLRSDGPPDGGRDQSGPRRPMVDAALDRPTRPMGVDVRVLQDSVQEPGLDDSHVRDLSSVRDAQPLGVPTRSRRAGRLKPYLSVGAIQRGWIGRRIVQRAHTAHPTWGVGPWRRWASTAERSTRNGRVDAWRNGRVMAASLVRRMSREHPAPRASPPPTDAAHPTGRVSMSRVDRCTAHAW
jgi:hypothetical protein